MKNLEFATGGRPVTNDDFQTLQSETFAAIYGPYLGRGAFIVTGCQVSGPSGGPYTVAPGILCLDGEFVRFYGASAATLPLQFERDVSTYAFLDERTYQTGGTKPCIREYAATLVPAVGFTGREFLTLTATGAKRWEHVVKAASRDIGDIQTIATSAYNPDHYDGTGKGLAGTEAWGWALANGQNGTEDMRTLTAAGMSTNPEYVAGATGGRASITIAPVNLPPTDPAQPKVATVTLGADFALVGSTGGNWSAQSLPGGNSQPIDSRSPYRALPMRQWIGYN